MPSSFFLLPSETYIYPPFFVSHRSASARHACFLFPDVPYLRRRTIANNILLSGYRVINNKQHTTDTTISKSERVRRKTNTAKARQGKREQCKIKILYLSFLQILTILRPPAFHHLHYLSRRRWAATGNASQAARGSVEVEVEITSFVGSAAQA